MLKRARQVYAALTASVTEADEAFVKRWLNEAQSGLFWAMNLPDQRHALNVAYTALRLNESNRNKASEVMLIKCCLLHDVGKVRGDVSTFDKVMAVAAYRLVPEYAVRHGRQGRGGKLQNLRHALYIYKHHARLGYDKLMTIGETKIARIIVKHHEPADSGDPVELSLLREADEMN